MSNGTALVNPDWLSKGDNAWQLTAASLVALQSIPGLAVLYAGLVHRRWVVNTLMMVFYGFGMTLLIWVLVGYKVAFGKHMLPMAGIPNTVLRMDDELQQSVLPSAGVSQMFPQSTMVYFQFVFAAITIVLTGGAYLARMNFTAWMVFVPLWLLFAYCPVAYSIWGGGFLYQLGVIDYSGGYVIHLSSGTAALVGSYWIGPRLQADRESMRPNNLPLMMVGAGILWVGWNGFNGGDPYTASPDAGAAVLNTNICTATSMLVWTMIDTCRYGKPSIIGAVNGMITGLVAITPAAGVVAGWGAIILGCFSGSVPWLSMNIAGRNWSLFRNYVDDAMGITHTHLVAGLLGGFLTGIFATKEGCAAFAIANAGGAIEGNGRQVWVNLVGGLFVIGWDLAWTTVILLFIQYVLRIKLRFSEEVMIVGDDAIHGEAAYCFFENEHGLVPPHWTVVEGKHVGGDEESGRNSARGDQSQAKGKGA